MKIIDMHCDTLSGALMRYGRKVDMLHMPELMVDLERMWKGNIMAQFFAVYMIPKEHRIPSFVKSAKAIEETNEELQKEKDKLLSDEYYIACCKAVFDHNMKLHEDLIAPACDAKDIEKNQRSGKMSAILTMEDGVAVEGKMENLKRFYDMGFRALNLTWNFENCFGAPNSKNPYIMSKGLTSFGKEAVEVMQDMGMLVDVSHLSDGGFLDVAQICKKPFIASHSNCRELCPHQRNLTDCMIHTLAEKGGVAGINFYPLFLNKDQEDMHSRITDMVAVAKHMKKVGGIEVIGLGSDFDGIEGELEIAGCDQFSLLEDAFCKAGFLPSEIDRIMGGNILRVLKDAL